MHSQRLLSKLYPNIDCNMKQRAYPVLLVCCLSALLLLFPACKKASSDLYTDNDAPAFSKVSSVKVRNFVNRPFIDLIGREPSDVEMDLTTAAVQSGNANTDSRAALVEKLMRDTTFRSGDTSYTMAYHKRIYDLGKIRFLEGVSQAQLNQQADIYRSSAISDSLGGNLSGYQQNTAKYQLLVNVLLSSSRYLNGEITLQQQYAAMLNNGIYDIINMNSFNFVNACYNDLFYRFPSGAEFNIGYAMVEDNVPGALYNQTGQNKQDFVTILTSGQECKEGIIVWSYQTLLARNPSSAELYDEMLKFGLDNDLKGLQKRLIITNEYANF